jgi:DNA-binding transcriptional LysR family regulator
MPSDPNLPNLTTQQLIYLTAAIEAPTWAQAAARLGVTQSALSQGIAELERRLEVTLFEWQGRRRVLRPQAEPVAEYASRVLTQTADLGRFLTGLREGHAGRLRVGMIDAAAIHHYADVLHHFRRARPEVELHLAVAASAALLEQLATGAVDLVVCVEPPTTLPGITIRRLKDEPLALYAPDGRRAGKPSSWGPWVTFPADSSTRRVIEAALADLGAPLEVVAESHQPEVLREMVRLGIGWTVLPVSQAESQPGALQRARREPLASRTLVIANRTESLPDTAARALIEALVAAI